ncbi:MAG: carboxypeptidase M32 [Erysipelotrichaceae bacterium]|nr:carboxypeptidase M32 [Erysipelotrichaceae bacterium]
MSELWNKYEEYMFKMSAYGLVLGTTSFDAHTVAPKGGAEYRNERMAYISGELYSLATSDELLEMLKKLSEDETLDDVHKRIVSWHLKDMLRDRCVPKEFFVEYEKLLMDANVAWEKAKNENDYQIFKPYLLKIIEMAKKKLTYLPDGDKGYDALLDEYEPGMTMAKYDQFFDLIREKLVPVIRKIRERPQIDDSFNYDSYPADKQKELAELIMKYIDFDFNAGILSTTEHPFTHPLQKQDVRVTTHYYEHSLISSIFSVIHECGHANYNHSVRDDLADTYVFDNISSGMHESQSRLFENYLARSYHFWDNLFEPMKAIFPEQLKDVTQQQFVNAVNKVECSLVRTEADELTYPLHVLVRYEMEKGIFDGTIDLERLDEIWDEKYEQYLGVRATKASEGILQDVHWSDGSFGYFPTYALGSGYAAQFMKAMKKDLDIDACLANNEFKKIKDWLREKIHQYGGLYLPSEQIVIATGEEFDPHNYTDYLVEKYSRLYGLSEE